MSLMNGDGGAVFTIMVACLALKAIMKDQVEQLNTITVAATAMSIDWSPARGIGILFSRYWPFAWQSLTPLVVCHAVFILCRSLLCVGFQFVGQSLKFPVSMLQREVDTWKPQAGSHVTGLWRRFVSGRNDVFLPLSTYVLSLPLAALFFYFFRALFSALRAD